MDKEILYLSPTYAGSVHDKKICELEQIEFSKKAMVMVDLGFMGLSSQTARIVMPHKRGKNQDLDQHQREANKWISKVRVKVEHVIGGVKIFRKVKEKFRGRLYAREDRVMLVACALYNLKLKAKLL